MDYLNRSIFVTLEFVGFHRWPDAPPEVDYLASRHRHLFKVRVDIGVDNNDRAIEYHIFKRQLEQAVYIDSRVVDGTSELEFGAMSCEAIAERLLIDIKELYPSQDYYRVEVSEDGENGSSIVA